MREYFSVRQAAELTGLSTHTLRYYEEAGLIGPVNRAASGHRRYSVEDIDGIRFMARLRAVGMPIRSMRRYVDLRREGPHTARERRRLLEEYGVEVKERIKELTGSLEMIEAKVKFYEEMETEDDSIARNA